MTDAERLEALVERLRIAGYEEIADLIGGQIEGAQAPEHLKYLTDAIFTEGTTGAGTSK